MVTGGTPIRGSKRLLALALAAIATISLFLAAASFGAAGAIVLVSEPNALSEGGFPKEQVKPAISGDGRFVAYVGSVGFGGAGVYLRDVEGGTTAVNVPEVIGEFGVSFAAGAPSLSGTGRYLAFASEDPALSDEDRNSSTTPAGDTFPVRDVFVYDRAGGDIAFASRNSGPKGAAGNADSNDPAISADGRYVAFSTQATNFVRGVFGGLFVRDLRTKETVLAGRANGIHGGPLRTAFKPSISAHGRWVAFVTQRRLLRRGRALEIVVRDMKASRTIFASRADGRYGAPAAGDCNDPSISADGRYVAFSSEAANLSPADDDSVEDVFVRDLRTSRTVLVSRGGGKREAAGNGDSAKPSISADGRYVAFESYADNLGPDDNGAVPDVFVRDMGSGRIFLASRGDGNGPAANAPSANPAISADGRYVTFDSRGSNLSPADTLRQNSVFRYQLLP